MPVAVFAWEWTYCDGSLPAAAEPLPAATRPFNPRLCCGTSFVSSRCPSYVDVRVFHSTSFISALLWRLLAGTESWSDSVRSVRKMDPSGIRSRNGSPGKHVAFIESECYTWGKVNRFCVHRSLMLSGFLFALCLGHLAEMLWLGDNILFYCKSLDNGYFNCTLSTRQMYTAHTKCLVRIKYMEIPCTLFV